MSDHSTEISPDVLIIYLFTFESFSPMSQDRSKSDGSPSPAIPATTGIHSTPSKGRYQFTKGPNEEDDDVPNNAVPLFNGDATQLPLDDIKEENPGDLSVNQSRAGVDVPSLLSQNDTTKALSSADPFGSDDFGTQTTSSSSSSSASTFDDGFGSNGVDDLFGDSSSMSSSSAVSPSRPDASTQDDSNESAESGSFATAFGAAITEEQSRKEGYAAEVAATAERAARLVAEAAGPPEDPEAEAAALAKRVLEEALKADAAAASAAANATADAALSDNTAGSKKADDDDDSNAAAVVDKETQEATVDTEASADARADAQVDADSHADSSSTATAANTSSTNEPESTSSTTSSEVEEAAVAAVVAAAAAAEVESSSTASPSQASLATPSDDAEESVSALPATSTATSEDASASSSTVAIDSSSSSTDSSSLSSDHYFPTPTPSISSPTKQETTTATTGSTAEEEETVAVAETATAEPTPDVPAVDLSLPAPSSSSFSLAMTRADSDVPDSPQLIHTSASSLPSVVSRPGSLASVSSAAALSAAQTLLISLEGRLAASEARLQASEAERMRLARENLHLDSEVSELRIASDSFQQTIEAEKEELMRLLIAQRVEFANMQTMRKAKYTALRSAHANAVAQVATLRAQNEGLRAQLTTTQDILSKDKTNLSAQQASLTASQSQLLQLQRKLDEALRETSATQERLATELEVNKDKLSADLKVAQTERDQARSELASMLEELNKLKAKLSETSARKQAEASLSASIDTEDGQAVYTGKTVMVHLRGEGGYSISWFRSAAGANYVPIPGAQAQGRVYTPTIDDLHCTLRAQCYHKASGAVISAEIGPVLPHPTLVEQMFELLKKTEIDFNVSAADVVVDPRRPETSASRQICLNRKRVKFQKLKQTVLKANLTEHVRITLMPVSFTRFNFFVDERKVAIQCDAADTMERDVIAGTVRMLVYQTIFCKDTTPEKTRAQMHSLLYQLTSINLPSSTPIVYAGTSKFIQEVENQLRQSPDDEKATSAPAQADPALPPSSAWTTRPEVEVDNAVLTVSSSTLNAIDGKKSQSSASTSTSTSSAATAEPEVFDDSTEGRLKAAAAMMKSAAASQEYRPTDIDDLFPAKRGAKKAAAGEEEPRGFGDLVTKDSDSEDDADDPRSRRGRGGRGGTGGGGSGTSASGKSGEGDDQVDARKPALSITIKAAGAAATLSADTFKSMLGGGLGAPPSAASALGFPPAAGGSRNARRATMGPLARPASTTSSSASSVSATSASASGRPGSPKSGRRPSVAASDVSAASKDSSAGSITASASATAGVGAGADDAFAADFGSADEPADVFVPLPPITATSATAGTADAAAAAAAGASADSFDLGIFGTTPSSASSSTAAKGDDGASAFGFSFDTPSSANSKTKSADHAFDASHDNHNPAGLASSSSTGHGPVPPPRRRPPPTPVKPGAPSAAAEAPSIITPSPLDKSGASNAPFSAAHPPPRPPSRSGRSHTPSPKLVASAPSSSSSAAATMPPVSLATFPENDGFGAEAAFPVDFNDGAATSTALSQPQRHSEDKAHASTSSSSSSRGSDHFGAAAAVGAAAGAPGGADREHKDVFSNANAYDAHASSSTSSSSAGGAEDPFAAMAMASSTTTSAVSSTKSTAPSTTTTPSSTPSKPRSKSASRSRPPSPVLSVTEQLHAKISSGECKQLLVFGSVSLKWSAPLPMAVSVVVYVPNVVGMIASIQLSESVASPFPGLYICNVKAGLSSYDVFAFKSRKITPGAEEPGKWRVPFVGQLNMLPPTKTHNRVALAIRAIVDQEEDGIVSSKDCVAVIEVQPSTVLDITKTPTALPASRFEVMASKPNQPPLLVLQVPDLNSSNPGAVYELTIPQASGHSGQQFTSVTATLKASVVLPANTTALGLSYNTFDNEEEACAALGEEIVRSLKLLGPLVAAKGMNHTAQTVRYIIELPS